MISFAPQMEKLGRAWRAWQMAWLNPRGAATVLREAYRFQVGIAFDRAFSAGRSDWPAVLNLELTRRCQLKCVMCPQIRGATPIPAELSWYDADQEMPLEAWVNVLEQATAFRPRLYITGGEPLLYRHFSQVIREAKRRHFYVEVQTNGTRLASAADLLVECGVEVVTVSLDGTPAVHDAIRGQAGAFKRLQAGLQAIRQARQRQGRPGPLLRGTCIITKHNLEILEQMAPLATELGLDVLRLEHAMFDTPANVARHNARLSPAAARAHGLDLRAPSVIAGEYYQNQIGEQDLPVLWSKLQQARRLARQIDLAVFPDLSEAHLRAYYQDLDFAFPQTCNALWKVCKVSSDGSVLPCLHLVMGNVRRQSLAEIWNGPPMVTFRNLIRRGLLPGCARCCRRDYR